MLSKEQREEIIKAILGYRDIPIAWLSESNDFYNERKATYEAMTDEELMAAVLGGKE